MTPPVVGTGQGSGARTADGAAGENRAEEPTDRELMARHVAGDAEAFGEIFRRHRDRLWAVALRTLANPEDAADALQDAMISAFRRADSYRGEAAVTTWLHRIVVNACLDRVRREAVRATDPLPEDDRSTQLRSRRDEIGQRESALDVTAALATLPVEQRAALVLVDMAGYSVNDAADILDVAVGTIKSRCARGRAKLLPLVRVGANGGGAALGDQALRDPAPGDQPPDDQPPGGQAPGDQAGGAAEGNQTDPPGVGPKSRDTQQSTARPNGRPATDDEGGDER